MSSRLQIVANHSLVFENALLPDIGNRVCEIFNEKLKFPNEHFLSNDFTERTKTAFPKNNWSYIISQSVLYGGLNESDYLQIKSPWQIELIVEEDHLLLFPYIHKTKHYHWFNFDPKTSGIEDATSYFAYQNEWSKIIMAIVETLGGDTAYILADMDYDHNYYSASNFKEIEQIIYEKCGPAKTHYEEMSYVPDEDDDITTPYLKITKDTVMWDLEYAPKSIR